MWGMILFYIEYPLAMMSLIITKIGFVGTMYDMNRVNCGWDCYINLTDSYNIKMGNCR